MCCAIQFGVYERPVENFLKGYGGDFGDILQSVEDFAFAETDPAIGWKTRIHQDISVEDAMRAKEATISSAFTLW